MIADPIFIVGTERSGSNLLRLILNAHDSISIPHPPHLMRDLHPLQARYGDLSLDRRFKRLVSDAARLVELHFAPWSVRIDRAEIIRRAEKRELYCVYAEIYEQHLKFEGKRRWGCKSTFMIDHIEQIVRFHSAPRILHLVRDGRDVASSAKSSVFSRFHPHYVSLLWRDQQRAALRWKSMLSPELFMTVRYEDLIARPDEQVRGICRFLGETYSEKMLRFFETESASKLSSLSDSWKNCAMPILSSNSGGYRAGLTQPETLEFERISFRELLHFGYRLENDAAGIGSASPGRADRLRFYLTEKARSSRVNLLALLRDRNAPLRLKKRLFLQKLRWL